MDVYFDHIYKIENGNFIQVHKGDYGTEDNSNVRFNKNEEPIYDYYWDENKVTNDEYNKFLFEAYNKYKQDEIIDYIKNLK